MTTVALKFGSKSEGKIQSEAKLPVSVDGSRVGLFIQIDSVMTTHWLNHNCGRKILLMNTLLVNVGERLECQHMYIHICLYI